MNIYFADKSRYHVVRFKFVLFGVFIKLIRRYEDTPEISCRGWLPHVRRLSLRETRHRFSFAPLGSFPNSFHFLKIFLKHDAMDVFLERIKDIKYRIFYECWRRKKKKKQKGKKETRIPPYFRVYSASSIPRGPFSSLFRCGWRYTLKIPPK